MATFRKSFCRQEASVVLEEVGFISLKLKRQDKRHLLAAGDGAAAQVSAGFGVDHGWNVFLRHQVREELLTALCLLPVSRNTRALKPVQKCLLGRKKGHIQDGIPACIRPNSPLSIQSHQFGYIIADLSLQHSAVLIRLPADRTREEQVNRPAARNQNRSTGSTTTRGLTQSAP